MKEALQMRIPLALAGMRRTSLMIIILSLFIMSWSAWSDVAYAEDKAEPDLNQPLNLEQAVNIALENNAGIRAAVEGIRGAEFDRQAAQRQRLPRIDAEAWYEEFPVKDKLLIPRHMDIPTLGDLATPTSDASTQRMLDFFSVHCQDRVMNLGGSLKWPLFTGGRITAQVQAAESGIQTARAQLAQARNDLMFNVAEGHTELWSNPKGGEDEARREVKECE